MKKVLLFLLLALFAASGALADNVPAAPAAAGPAFALRDARRLDEASLEARRRLTIPFLRRALELDAATDDTGGRPISA